MSSKKKLLIEALTKLQASSHLYDPDLLQVFKKFVAAEKQYVVKTINVMDLAIDMLIARDMKTSSGLLLIAKGQTVTPTLKERLSNFTKTQEINGTVEVLVPDIGHDFVAD